MIIVKTSARDSRDSDWKDVHKYFIVNAEKENSYKDIYGHQHAAL